MTISDPSIDDANPTPDDLAITEAWNAEGQNFTIADIDDSELHEKHLAKTILHDELLRKVRAVRSSDRARAHFRLISASGDGTRIDRSENDPLHNDTVRSLYVEFSKAQPFEVCVPKRVNGQWIEEQIWCSRPERPLTWKCDPMTRIWIDSTQYFQPDLIGFDPVSAHPGPRNRWIIVEVVHHHWPEEAAWEALVRLSKTNHLVLFYLVRPQEQKSWINKWFYSSGRLFLKVSYYLLDGCLYGNSVEIKVSEDAIHPAGAFKAKVFEDRETTIKAQAAFEARQRAQRGRDSGAGK